MNRKHIFWFDLHLTFEEIEKVEKVRGKRSQMKFLEEALREKLEREVLEETK